MPIDVLKISFEDFQSWEANQVEAGKGASQFTPEWTSLQAYFGFFSLSLWLDATGVDSKCGFGALAFVIEVYFPITVNPDSVTVKPRLRSCSGSKPIRASSGMMTPLSMIAFFTIAFFPTWTRSNKIESDTFA